MSSEQPLIAIRAAATYSIVKTVLFVLVFVLAAPLAAQDYEAGEKAYARGDYAAALLEWRPLAEQGDPLAQTMLGIMYDFHQGVAHDDAEAVKWYRMAAIQGGATAQYLLGSHYFWGQGAAWSHGTAAIWYRKAAEQGLAEAQSALGGYYAQHRSHIVQAHMWYNFAASQGDEYASKALGELEKEMSQTQIAEAEKIAREWRPK